MNKIMYICMYAQQSIADHVMIAVYMVLGRVSPSRIWCGFLLYNYKVIDHNYVAIQYIE